MSRPRRRALLGPWGVAAGCLLAGLLAASPESRAELPAHGWRTLRVGVLAVPSFVRGPEDLFAPRPVVRRLQREAGQWQLRLERALRGLDQVQALSASEVSEALMRVPGRDEALALAAERLALGVEAYRALKGEEALAHFTRATAIHANARAPFSAPQQAADAAFFEGLVHLEGDDTERVDVAFRRMFLLDPGRTFQEGYYPATVQRALSGALFDLTAPGSSDTLDRRYPVEDLQALAQEVPVDAWLTAALVGSPAEPALVVRLVDASTGQVTALERVPLADPERAATALDRMLTAWLSCTVEVASNPSLVLPPPSRRWFVEVGYHHALYLKHEVSRGLLQAGGVRVEVSVEATDNLLIGLHAIQSASYPDPDGDLRSPLITTRLGLTVGLVGGTDTLRFYAQAGPEVSVITGDVTMTRDVDCKHFGLDSPRCGSFQSITAPRALFGLSLDVGVRWIFGKNWFLSTAVGLTNWVVEGEIVRDLNFPLNVHLSVGNRF